MLYIGTGKEAVCVDPAVGREVNGLRTSRDYLDCFNLSEIKVYLRIRTGSQSHFRCSGEGGSWGWVVQWPGNIKSPFEVYGHKFKVNQDSCIVYFCPQILSCVGAGLERQRGSTYPGWWLRQASKKQPEGQETLW